MLTKTADILTLCLKSPHLPQILMAAVCIAALAVAGAVVWVALVR